MQRIDPYMFRSTHRCHSDGSMSTNGCIDISSGTPALFTSTSIGPPSSAVTALDSCCDGGLVGDVEGNGDGACTEFDQLIDGARGPVACRSLTATAAPARAEHLRDARTDALTGAGHERYPSCQIEHLVSSELGPPRTRAIQARRATFGGSRHPRCLRSPVGSRWSPARAGVSARRTAIRLAELGARVAITARTDGDEPGARLAGSLETTLAAIRAAGAEGFAVVADLTDADDRQRIVPAVHDELGPIDVLVNNAAAAIYAPVGRRCRCAGGVVVRGQRACAGRPRAGGGAGHARAGRGSIVNVTSRLAVGRDRPAVLRHRRSERQEWRTARARRRWTASPADSPPSCSPTASR